jgi:hypothetical protein
LIKLEPDEKSGGYIIVSIWLINANHI